MLLLHAAGSLDPALHDVARAWEAVSGTGVRTTFGPSGLLRARIEAGENTDIFASADMEHPRALAEQGLGGPVRRFARNRLCAIVQPDIKISSETLLDVLLDESMRLSTSTPTSDPSGDYAWALFEKAEKLRPGAFARLDARALKLTGGPDSERAPEGRNPYGWVMAENKADVFLTYRTNAMLAQKDTPGLRIVRIPDELCVAAEYGLTVLKGAPESAGKLADFILAPAGQEILAGYGFEPRQDR